MLLWEISHGQNRFLISNSLDIHRVAYSSHFENAEMRRIGEKWLSSEAALSPWHVCSQGCGEHLESLLFLTMIAVITW